jgi:uncharacterized 2Fe-2S/4Fe-4S cluster protein (DUF4445 family)
MEHFTVTFKPDEKQIAIHAGASVIEAAGLAGIVLNTFCGEKGTCGKCAVTIEPQGRRVLACQYRIESDLTITIPSSSRFFEHKILAEGIRAKAQVEPDIYKKYLQPAKTVSLFGLAVDIGTTTVVVKLVDMKTGQTVATQAALNPQARFGDDVISRIAYAQTDEKLAELHKSIIDCLNDLIARLCADASIKPRDIYEASVVGNTTMNHIFLNLPIQQLGQAPYKAYSLDAKDVTPATVGLEINPAGNIHTVENIAGFVGADTTAVALATGIGDADQITLAIDIGTNGEVVLGTKDKLYAASCAAGPAFEGARISCGGRAVEGAIEAVVANKSDIDFDVIGDIPAHSICGSGLVDVMAILLDIGVIDKTGRFNDPATVKTSRLATTTVAGVEGPAFVIAYHDNIPVVYLNQKDIRELQLAKAAIRAGIKLLQKRLNITDSDIKQIYLAGAFGNYIRRESALRIGLLPDVPIERIHSVGNAACSGAQMALISSHCRKSAGHLARKIQYVEIAHDPDFQTVFADSMLF